VGHGLDPSDQRFGLVAAAGAGVGQRLCEERVHVVRRPGQRPVRSQMRGVGPAGLGIHVRERAQELQVVGQ
jgi:hypothetical protein